MKQNSIKSLLAVVLAIISIGAWADDRVTIADMQNGTITASGEQTVTLTVTPATNYYIETGDIIVSKTTDVAQARQNTPGYTDQLIVTAVSVDDTGKGTYQFTLPDGYGAYVEATFTPCIAITPQVSITGWTYGAYDATANAPSVTGNTGNGTVTYTYAVKGTTDYVVEIPVNAGDYTVKATIAAAGHYLAGEATTDFTIAKATMEVTATGYEGIYDGQSHGISVQAPEGAVVKYGEAEGAYNLDNAPAYTNAGSYTVYYQVMKDNYVSVTGSQEVKISAKAIENGMIAAIADQTYTGTELKPAVSVTDGNTTLMEATDYTVSYANNVNVGTATVTVTGIGNYSGTVSTTFVIVAAKEALKVAIEEATAYYESIKDEYADVAATLKEAINAAKAILDKSDATQEEVDAAIPVLNAAVQAAKEAVAAISQQAADKQAFADYQAEQKAAADALAEDGDSEACQQLIADAKIAIDALTYDEGKTLDENKAAVDAILEQLKSDLAAQREADAAAAELAEAKEELNGALDDATNYYDSIKEDYPDIAHELKEIIDKTQEVLDKPDATKEEIKAAKEKLRDTLEAIKKAVEEASNILFIVNSKQTNGKWYDLKGRQLPGKPTMKGIYILNGRKIVVR